MKREKIDQERVRRKHFHEMKKKNARMTIAQQGKPTRLGMKVVQYVYLANNSYKCVNHTAVSYGVARTV